MLKKIAALFLALLVLSQVSYATGKTTAADKPKQRKADAREQRLRDLAQAYKAADAAYEAAMASAVQARDAKVKDITAAYEAEIAAAEEARRTARDAAGDDGFALDAADDAWAERMDAAWAAKWPKDEEASRAYSAALDAARKTRDYEYKKINAAREVDPATLRNVPLRDQFEEANGNLGESACGPTSLGMALQYFGINIPTPDIIREMGIDPRTGATIGQMIDYANKHLPGSHFSWGTAFGADEISYLEDKVSGGGLAIVPIEGEYDSGKVAPEGHYVVVTDVREGYVFANDPAGGEKVVFDKQEFGSLWKSGSEGGKPCVVVKK